MREELRKELTSLKKELEDKLSAVNQLLGIPIVNSGSISVQTKIDTDDSNDLDVMSKGDYSWPDYWLKVARTFTNEYKAKQVADIGVKGNPEIDETVVRNSAKYWLSKHAKNGEINARRGASLKAGNTYWNLKKGTK